MSTPPAPTARPLGASPNPADERVSFVQHQLPGLDSGVYRLSVAQHVLETDDTTPVSTDPISRDYTFAVGGPRFRLTDPSSAISSVFPAGNATGDFHTVLPHAVLTTPALPWIRSPQGSSHADSEGDSDTVPVATDADVPSWLAVLTLDADDLAAYPALQQLDPVTATIGDLFPPAAYPDSKLPAGTQSYFDGATDTDGLEPGEAPTDPIQVIDVPLALFALVAPSLADLGLNSHVRQLSLQPKPALLGADPPSDPLGTFSIVIGNRLPQNQQTSHAYLVCLEGLSSFLPPGGTAAGTLRLAVLAHWTFVSQGDPVDFTTTLAALNHRTGSADGAVTTLRLAPAGVPPSGVGAAIGAALNAGNAPLTHRVRTGETTVSWYHGPLSPLAEPPAADLPVPYSCSDQALVFDPTTGLFDASLSAAWTVGRLIALQDKGFSTALYAWKRGLSEAVADAAEQSIVAELLGPELLATVRESGARATETKPLLHATMRLLSQGSRS